MLHIIGVMDGIPKNNLKVYSSSYLSYALHSRKKHGK